jgi:hypothetical protein
MVSEPSPAFIQSKGSDVARLSSLVLVRFQNTQNLNWLLGYLVTYVPGYEPLVVASLIGIAPVAIAGLARSRELSASQFMENTLGLGRQDLYLLARVSSSKEGVSGKDLDKSSDEGGDFKDWSAIQVSLGRLQSLGLVERRIRVKAGLPRSLWISRLR